MPATPWARSPGNPLTGPVVTGSVEPVMDHPWGRQNPWLLDGAIWAYREVADPPGAIAYINLLGALVRLTVVDAYTSGQLNDLVTELNTGYNYDWEANDTTIVVATDTGALASWAVGGTELNLASLPKYGMPAFGLVRDVLSDPDYAPDYTPLTWAPSLSAGITMDVQLATVEAAEWWQAKAAAYALLWAP